MEVVNIKTFADLTIEEREKELDKIMEAEKILEDYEVYLQFGTLLGCIREQALIENDDDIDLCYMSKYHTREEVQEEMKELYRKFIRLGIMRNYFTTEKTKHWWKEIEDEDVTEDIIDPFGQCHIRVAGGNVDLFTSWIDTNGDYYTCQWGNFGNATQYFPLTEGTIYGKQFKIPQNSEKILERLYGDWRTPRREKPLVERRAYINEWK